MLFFITTGIALALLLVGSYTDIRTREVPDWINYAAIFAGLGVRLLYSVVTFEWMELVKGLLGFGVFFVIACCMFYLGQWGGGDAKTMMGLGGLIGFSLSFDHLFYAFLVNMLLVGAVYGIFWVGVFTIKDFRKVMKRYTEEMNKKTMLIIRAVVVVVVLGLILLGMFGPLQSMKTPLLLIAGVTFFTFFLIMLIKIVEEVCMIKQVRVGKLTEGDWIQQDFVLGKKVLIGKGIIGKKELGVVKKIRERDVFVEVVRTYLYFFKKKKKVLLSLVYPEDELLGKIVVDGKVFSKGKVLSEKDWWHIQNFLNKKAIFPVSVRRKIFGIWFTKEVSGGRLREGDEMLSPLYVGHYLCGPKDLGISQEQISVLKSMKVNSVMVKEGMPFIPSFLVGFIVSLVVGNPVFMFL